MSLVLFLLGGVVAPAGATNQAEPTGASLCWTSSDPVVSEARQLMEQGEFTRATRLLQGAAPAADPDAVRARDETVEIIRRIRRDFDLDLDGLVSGLRASIPDVTPEDVERWRKAGQVQHRIIDGRVCYFRREPSNLFRFCSEAITRRKEHAATKPASAPKEPAYDRAAHVAKILAAAERTGKELVLPVLHRVHCALTILPNRPNAKPGSLVRCWLMFPQEYRQQANVRLLRIFPADHVLAPNAVDGNPIGGAPQRTVYLEQRIADPSRSIIFELEFEYVVHSYCPVLDEAKARPLPADYRGGCLDERLPHIAFTPEMKAAVRSAVGEETNPLLKARRIFRFIAENIRYCSEQEYCNIPSLSVKALATGKGDCGIHAALFITMCRIAGIPARWQSGWATEPGTSTMHDWAEFYVEPWGWLPADPSYGLIQRSGDPKVQEFFLGHMDSYRLIANLDYGSPLQPPKRSLRSEPADFQRGEVEIDGRNLYFDEWDSDLEFQYEKVGW